MNKKLYREVLAKEGFLTLCYLIELLSDIEFYEECAVIKKILDDYSKEVGCVIPTTISEETIEFYESSYQTIPPTKKYGVANSKLKALAMSRNIQAK